jgi:hypothetical protein
MAFFELNDDEYWLQAPAQGWDPPAVSVLEMAPNYTLFKHAHPCYRFEIIVRGEMTNEHGVVLKPGDVMTAAPMEVYGPHTAGPEGCVTLEVFSQLGDAMRVFTDDKDGNFREFDSRKGEIPDQYELIVREVS